ncbi:MAG: hypothetical protein ABI672_19630 [Vicinamibacteria bacterium]
MHRATFVLSTGRCGTQWLARKLDAAFKDSLRVSHEPLDNEYQPRLMLGRRTPHALDEKSCSVILRHVEEIERGLEIKPYVECGHPCWSTLPYLASRLGEKMQILHLIRHPIPTALSWLSRSAYLPPLLPHLREKVLLSAFDEGVTFTEYRDRWSSLLPFEKCVYYWAEVNAFGLNLEKRATVPWLRVSFENLFEGRGLESIERFLGVPDVPSIQGERAEIVDEHRSLIGEGLPDLDIWRSHPALLETAIRLGYDSSDLDHESLGWRYAPFVRSPG